MRVASALAKTLTTRAIAHSFMGAITANNFIALGIREKHPQAKRCLKELFLAIA